jgi:hypothetical protein
MWKYRLFILSAGQKAAYKEGSMKNFYKFLGIITVVAVIGFSVIGCFDDDDGGNYFGGNNSGGNNSGGNNSGGNNSDGNNFGGNNSGGNNSGGNNSGGNNSGGNNDKTFTFRVKNEARGYTISRVRVIPSVNKTGLNVSYGQYSSSITYTLTDGYLSFNVLVFYDSSYPDIYAGIFVDDSWPTSFDLRLWNDNGTFRLSRIQ